MEARSNKTQLSLCIYQDANDSSPPAPALQRQLGLSCTVLIRYSILFLQDSLATVRSSRSIIVQLQLQPPGFVQEMQMHIKGCRFGECHRAQSRLGSLFFKGLELAHLPKTHTRPWLSPCTGVTEVCGEPLIDELEVAELCKQASRGMRLQLAACLARHAGHVYQFQLTI